MEPKQYNSFRKYKEESRKSVHCLESLVKKDLKTGTFCKNELKHDIIEMIIMLPI